MYTACQEVVHTKYEHIWWQISIVAGEIPFRHSTSSHQRFTGSAQLSESALSGVPFMAGVHRLSACLIVACASTEKCSLKGQEILAVTEWHCMADGD